MRSIIAASVVDLPLPVGPVTSTRPFSASQKVRSDSGKPRSSKRGIFPGMVRNTAPSPRFWTKTLARKRSWSSSA
jgi:hypothetical protein